MYETSNYGVNVNNYGGLFASVVKISVVFFTLHTYLLIFAVKLCIMCCFKKGFEQTRRHTIVLYCKMPKHNIIVTSNNDVVKRSNYMHTFELVFTECVYFTIVMNRRLHYF